MGWQDDPVVGQQPWEKDPVVQPQGGNVFHGVSRALEGGIPFMDRAVAAGKSYLPTLLGGNDQGYAQNLQDEQAKNTQFEQQNPYTAAAGALTASAPLALLPGGAATLPGRMAIGGLEGAGIGGAYGASSSPDLTNAAQTVPPALHGAEIGGAAGALTPLATGLLGRAVTPLPTDAARQNLSELLQAHGVPLSAGDITGRPALKGLENEGLGGSAFNRNQSNAFTGAVKSEAGLPTQTTLGPDIATDSNVTGRLFNGLTERNTLVPNKELFDKVDAAVANQTTPTPGVQKMADTIKGLGDSVPGRTYQDLRSELGGKAWRLRNSDADSAGAYKDMQSALDNAMSKSIAVNNPADSGAWEAARRQYGNLQTVGKVAARTSGDAAAEGQIPPNTLQSVLKSGREVNYAAQKGPLDALAKAGTSMGIGQPPVAPTLGKAVTSHLLGAALGGTYGYERGSPGEGLSGSLIGGIAGPKIAGTLLRSPPMQKWLANQLMTRLPTSTMNPSPLAAALSAGYSNAP